jgi:hypothetical protein
MDLFLFDARNNAFSVRQAWRIIQYEFRLCEFSTGRNGITIFVVLFAQTIQDRNTVWYSGLFLDKIPITLEHLIPHYTSISPHSNIFSPYQEIPSILGPENLLRCSQQTAPWPSKDKGKGKAIPVEA